MREFLAQNFALFSHSLKPLLISTICKGSIIFYHQGAPEIGLRFIKMNCPPPPTNVSKFSVPPFKEETISAPHPPPHTHTHTQTHTHTHTDTHTHTQTHTHTHTHTHTLRLHFTALISV